VTRAVGLRVTGDALLVCVASLLSSEALSSRCEARQEVREGAHEVGKARREIRREVREDDYDRFYRGAGRWYRDGDEFLKGALVGAAVVGVAVAVANSDDD
jgi:hypothetical protein